MKKERWDRWTRTRNAVYLSRDRHLPILIADVKYLSAVCRYSRSFGPTDGIVIVKVPTRPPALMTLIRLGIATALGLSTASIGMAPAIAEMVFLPPIRSQQITATLPGNPRLASIGAAKFSLSDSAFLEVTLTPDRTEAGERLLNVDLVLDGQVIQRLQAISGKPDVQYFRTGRESIAGSREPLPQGIYTIGAVDQGPDLPLSLGPIFIEIFPQFATQRSALGIHLDGDRAFQQGAGTLGCLGLLSQQDIDTVTNFVTTYHPRRLVVDYGL